LVRLLMQLGRERSSERSLFKNNLRLQSHTLALNTPAHDRGEDDIASTGCVIRWDGAIDRCGFLREGSGVETGGAVSVGGVVNRGDAVDRGGVVKTGGAIETGGAVNIGGVVYLLSRHGRRR
jgi:hypothetical protein